MSENKSSRGQRRKELEQQKKSKQSSKKGLFKKIFMAVIIIGLAGLLFGAGLFAFYASSAPALEEENLKDPISTEVYDINDELFATFGAENRDYVGYEEIPKLMEDAILATEDVRFYDHMGIDFYRLGGAVIANFTSGFGSQGASTLTQQVIKNSFLQNEKTLKRKAQEAYLAYQLEQEYEKEEIFEMYFNKVLMSGRIYGFGTASQSFYGRELKDLQLHEVALLAGMPQSPNNFNPFKHPESAEKRRNIVLRLMEQHGKITKAEMEKAQAIPIAEGLLPAEKVQAAGTKKYDAYLDVVLNEIERKSDGDSLSDGLKVYTTLDPKAQESVEKALKGENFPTENMQAGLTVIDTKTGAIVAIGGGRDYGPDRGLNFAEDRKDRHIGSTAKPLVDYGPAIEYLSWSTGQTTNDERITYSNSEQQINNFDGEYLGEMTIREALYRSRNVPAVKTFREVDLEKRKDFANALGMPTEKLGNESSAIGGFAGMNTIDLAAAYAAFGNSGIYTEPYTIRSIEYRDGKTKRSFEPKPTPAMKDSTAYMVTDMLRDVVSERRGASGAAAAVSGVDIAGKTGTTNYSQEEKEKYNLGSSYAPDVWFAGYSTNYSISVWTGYEKRDKGINTADRNERTFAQRLFKSVMTDVSANKETAKFKRPNSVIEATIEVGSSPLRLASDWTPDELKQTELFVRGSEPTQVSETYEQIEIEAPSKLKADYSEGDQTATLSWDHKKPKRGKDDVSVSFEVSVSVDGAGATVLQTTDQKGLIVQGIEPGKSYTFIVVAIADEVRSEPASATLEIQAEEVEPEPEPEEENPDDENSGNEGNGNGNGNDDGEGGTDDGGTTDDGSGTGDEEPPADDGGDTTPPEEEADTSSTSEGEADSSSTSDTP